MTRREVVSRLRGDLNEHFGDSVIYNRHLWNDFWTASKVLIQRESDVNKLINQHIFKPYNLDTEEVNLYEGSCVPIECVACRVKLPKVIMSKTGMVYSFLGSPDMSTRIYVVNPSDFIVKSKIKGNRALYAFFEDDYLYFSKCMPCVKLLAVTEDSDEPTDGKCSIMDQEVGMSDYLLEGAFALAKESLMVALRKQYDVVPNKDPNS